MTNIQYEKDLLSKNINLIAGVDEVGRGCLAGPMVIAAVILNAHNLRELTNNDVVSEEFKPYTQITDSKLINPKKRDQLSNFLYKVVISYSIQSIEPALIDEIGIAQATQLGFYNAVQNLHVKPEYILTDAFAIKKFPQQIQTNIIKGDRKSVTIGAASILAKVFRDNLMSELHHNPKYEPYGFDRHKGYGTEFHIQMLQKYGPSDLHRKSFDPLKSMLK
ncbi:MAG TPA: ribonuclease HII [Candidatus Saccharimonadales bacterium]|nr:ribonuclease HII [Candidatus Saccharimonadales bacterium]